MELSEDQNEFQFKKESSAMYVEPTTILLLLLLLLCWCVERRGTHKT